MTISVETDKNRAYDLFRKVAANPGFQINSQEIDRAKNLGEITPNEASLLREAYDIQGNNASGKFNNKPEMELWEYMQAINMVMRQNIFDELEIPYANREYITQAMEGFPPAFEYADEGLKRDRNFVLGIVEKYGPSLLRYADPILLNDPDFQIASFAISFHSTLWFPNPVKEVKDEYSHIIERAKNLNIKRLGAFIRTNTLLEILRNREGIGNLPKDQRPVSLVIFPKWEKPSLDLINLNRIPDLLNHNYNVIYYEAESRKQISEIVKNVGSRKKISFLTLNAHGDSTRMLFGTSKLGLFLIKIFEPFLDIMLDVGDFRKMKGENLQQYIEAGGVIVLEGCEAGKGGGKGENLANMFGSLFPESHIFAPLGGITLPGYVFDDNTEMVVDVKFAVAGGAYHILPNLTMKGLAR